MTYTLIRSKKRRRSLALRVTETGEIVVRAPLYTPKLFIDHFVRTKSAWIAKEQSKKSTPPLLATPHFTESELKQYVNSQIDKYSAILDLYPTELKFKSVKSYWGNCAPSGRLTFNLHLRYAPASAVEYVVVHELVHLRHKGHGKRFWNLVTKTYPRANDMRRVLRKISR